MNDDAIRSAVRSAVDPVENTPHDSMDALIRSVSSRAAREGAALIALCARSRGLWWLCAASVLVAFACVRMARKEQRLTALSVAEVSWSL